MKKIMLFVILMNTLALYSQNGSNVCVVDENGMSIPYVHIRLSVSDGLISSANGCFTLNKDIDRDSLVYISHIAFEPRQLTIGSIGDTIHLVSKAYSINEVVFSQVNIYKLLTNAFKPVSYDAKRNYCSTRLFATGDSLVYFSEELFKLTKFDEKKMIMKRKLFGAIYYNASSKDSNYISFPISSSIRNNPYWFYRSETNLLSLIKIASIEKQYENFYKVKAKTDSSEITMYVSKENGRLLRFEKTMTPHKQKNVRIGETSYSYDFEIGKNNIVVIKSFKYQAMVCPLNSSICFNQYISDILIDNPKGSDSLSFKTLKELKQHKQKQQIVDANLYKYFSKAKPEEKNRKKTLSNLGQGHYFPKGEAVTNAEGSNVVVLTLPQSSSSMAVYDKSIMNYRYYPATVKMNFNLYSPRVECQRFSPTKMDNFNPYGTSKPQEAVVLGVIDYFLQEIQK